VIGRARARVVGLAATAACWTGSAPVTSPGTAASAEPPRRDRAAARAQPTWRPAPERAQPAIASRDPIIVARELAAQLRSNAQVAQAFVAGPIVVLDLDTASLTTECDVAAWASAQRFGQLLADPARPAVHCRPTTEHFTCSQFGGGSMLIMELADPARWRIISVIAGNYTTGRHALSMKLSQLRAQIDAAACP
jgi:hypothetical protein